MALTEAQLKAFNSALAAFQGEVLAARRDGKNPHFRTSYATLASVLDAVKPACKHGLSHTQICERDGDQVVLVTTLRHKEGYEVTSELPLAIGSDWQRFGSAFTYARRYALMGIYGIASSDDDDDGNSATNPVPNRRPAVVPGRKTVDEIPESTPLEARALAITQSLAALHEADPGAIKPLVDAYKSMFNIPAKTPVARSLDEQERLDWLEQRLGLVSPPDVAPDATAP